MELKLSNLQRQYNMPNTYEILNNKHNKKVSRQKQHVKYMKRCKIYENTCKIYENTQSEQNKIEELTESLQECNDKNSKLMQEINKYNIMNDESNKNTKQMELKVAKYNEQIDILKQKYNELIDKMNIIIQNEKSVRLELETQKQQNYQLSKDKNMAMENIEAYKCNIKNMEKQLIDMIEQNNQNGKTYNKNEKTENTSINNKKIGKNEIKVETNEQTQFEIIQQQTIQILKLQRKNKGKYLKQKEQEWKQ
eukprot:534195_1